MADGPWRCSECGTINEPVANSCRTCGRWPSLFDLERSTIQGPETQEAHDESRFESAFESKFEQEQLEPELFEPEVFEEGELETVLGEEPEPESRTGQRGRLIRSLIVPIAFAIYIVISIIFGDRGS